jgi:aspartyl-tRNA(Asn)/glutamyl-tRNA(Gln) amidotransferase subunit A
MGVETPVTNQPATELHFLDATTALRLFRARELSPVELMSAVINRVKQAEPAVNACSEQLFDQAMKQAQIAEARYASDEVVPPLLGIPLAAKDRHSIRGHAYSNGLLAHRDRIAESDHPMLERARAAGAIVHIRTTTPELCCATITHSGLWGTTRNPWDLRYSPGGSSGGSAAALAAGFTPLATASDMAGSTRLPAAYTGTVGFKPPYGRIPGPTPLSADHYRSDGPMARTVADAALLATTVAGIHRHDHMSSADPVPVCEPAADVDLSRSRIALCIRLGDYPVAADVEKNTRGIADLLRDAGAVVDEIELPWTAVRIREILFTHFGHVTHDPMLAETLGDSDLAAYTRKFMTDAFAARARNSFSDGLAAESAIQRELIDAMTGYDALICPTSAVPALRAGDDYLDGIDVEGRRLPHYFDAQMAAPFNIANRCPVLAVPSGFADCGLPTGIQVVAHPYDDPTAFRIGAAIEQLRPWNIHRPRLASDPA